MYQQQIRMQNKQHSPTTQKNPVLHSLKSTLKSTLQTINKKQIEPLRYINSIKKSSTYIHELELKINQSQKKQRQQLQKLHTKIEAHIAKLMPHYLQQLKEVQIFYLQACDIMNEIYGKVDGWGDVEELGDCVRVFEQCERVWKRLTDFGLKQ